MEPFKTEALVFQSKPFKEFDKRVIFLTKDFGKLSAIAPYAQKSLRRFGSALESLTWVSLVCTEKNNSSLMRLEEAQIMNNFSFLKKDIKKMAYGSYFLEVISEVMREKEYSEWLFQFLTSFLKALEKSKQEELLARLFEARLLPKIGYEPILHECVKCKTPLDEMASISFSFLEGGIKCQNCSSSSPFLDGRGLGGGCFSKASILYLQKMMKNPKSIAVDIQLNREIKIFLPQFLFFQLGKELKSYQFIETMSL